MPKISKILLHSLDPEAQRRFYSEILGMSIFDDGSVGYGEQEARLQFLLTDIPYHPSPTDLYWKISLAVPNIELACQQLMDRDIVVSSPFQKSDVGYLAHFKDPEGFSIELIEHWFKGNRQAVYSDNHLLGGGAHLNLLTLRTVDIKSVQRMCESWGMVPLAIYPMEGHEFSLYFFAFTDDKPPTADLYAVENREWLYQRRYTLLEVQYLHNAAAIADPDENGSGYKGAVISNMGQDMQSNHLRIWTEPH